MFLGNTASNEGRFNEKQPHGFAVNGKDASTKIDLMKAREKTQAEARKKAEVEIERLKALLKAEGRELPS